MMHTPCEKRCNKSLQPSSISVVLHTSSCMKLDFLFRAFKVILLFPSSITEGTPQNVEGFASSDCDKVRS